MAQILELGSEFAGYRIEALIGRGGMGELYRAENPRLGNNVALKLLAPELAEERLFRERFVRESRLAASLNHPNVIPIFDAGEEQGLLYIAMRYVDGPDLKALLHRDGPLPLESALSIVGQVGSALDCGHHRGLIHRDVKPANILLEEGVNGAEGHVYLSDFGVAKHTLSRSGLTSTGQFVGTIDYIAPEQIEGKTLDGRADVYSLGCVLFEALTGIPPFDRESNVAMMYAHLLEPPPSLSERRPDLPGAVDEVIETALAKDPVQRYETCHLLVEGLRERSTAPAAASTVAAPASPTVAAAAASTQPAAVPPTLAPSAPAGAPPLAGAPSAPPSFPPVGPDVPAGARRRGRKRFVALVALVVAAVVAATAAGMSLVGGGDEPGPGGDRLRGDRSSPGGEGGFSEVDPTQPRGEGKPSRGDRLRPGTGGNERDTTSGVLGKKKTKVARGDRLNRPRPTTTDRIREASPTPPTPPTPDRIRTPTPPAPPSPPPAPSDRLRGGGSSGGGGSGGSDRLRP